MYFENLENRRHMSVSLTSRGTLLINGSEGDDVVSIANRSGMLTVVENGITLQFDPAQVRRISANLGGGSDTFASHGTLRKRMEIDGGTGADNIRSGYGDDRLLGSAGDDRLNGSEGFDYLEGGRGADVLVNEFVLALDRADIDNHPFITEVRLEDDEPIEVVVGNWLVSLDRHVEGWVPYDETDDPRLLRHDFEKFSTRGLEAFLASLPFPAECGGMDLATGKWLTIRTRPQVTLQQMRDALSTLPGFKDVSLNSVLRVCADQERLQVQPAASSVPSTRAVFPFAGRHRISEPFEQDVNNG